MNKYNDSITDNDSLSKDFLAFTAVTMISSIIFSFGISDTFALLIIFAIIYVAKFYYQYFTRPNPLPGPFPLPILGNLHQIIGSNFNDWLISLNSKYGDMFETYLGRRKIVLCRTDLIENIFVPSTKTNYLIRNHMLEGFKELGLNESGIINNTDRKS